MLNNQIHIDQSIYSGFEFADSIISSIRKQYIDTRTQANLSKLNANRHRELDIVTGNMSNIIERRRNSGKFSVYIKEFLCLIKYEH